MTALLDGKFAVPVDTYFTVGTQALPPRIVDKIIKDEEICPNLRYLGKRSVTKTVGGVRIVALGGILDAEIVGGQSKEQHLPFHTLDDAKALKGANTTDILLTSIWPASVWKNSKTSLPVDPTSIPSTEAIANLCTALKPRYHFSTSPSDFCFEREPFFYPADGTTAESTTHFTRFISLAPFRNAAKAKASYAFHLQPGGGVPPADLTASPFTQSTNLKKRRHDDSNGFHRFSDSRDANESRHRQRRRIAGPDECFFCVARPEFTGYMVCALGDESYCSTAKGPLPSQTTFAENGLPFPTHMIIAPYAHAPTLSTASLGAEAGTTFKEMARFREALQAMIASKSKRKLGAVTWEINRQAAIHTHWQFMPVPSDLVSKDLVEAAFKVEAENVGAAKFEIRDFGPTDEIDGDFLRVWIWAEIDGVDGGRIVSKSLVMRFDESVRRFDLQFARKVMAKLLRLEKRVVWRDVAQSQEEEEADAEAVKSAFKEWDFTQTTTA